MMLACTTPVVAASTVPTMMTAIASPPRAPCSSVDTAASISSAMPLRSSTSPISVKNGMASSTSLKSRPYTRSMWACAIASGKKSSAAPSSVKAKPCTMRVRPTGKPSSRAAAMLINISAAMPWFMLMTPDRSGQRSMCRPPA
jgi:hypothetical protein